MNIYKDAISLKPWLVSLRRDIHSHPEMDFNLERTASLVEKELSDMGLSSKRIAGTGVISYIKGKKPGPAVLLRADMDALPIEETPGRSYGSTVSGVMHACGHDCHTACLLGVAKLLSERIDEMAGTALLVFQPAEETSGGAKPMLDEGILGDGDFVAALALHADPTIETGYIGINPGKARAASDMFNIRIKGSGCHGAEPHRGVDAIAIACQTVIALQQIVSRRTDPTDSSVLTVGKFNAGTGRNVVAEEAVLEGILRTTDVNTRKRLYHELREIAIKLPKTMGARADMEFTRGYPALVNDPAICHIVSDCAEKILGDKAVINLDRPSMGVDDFAYFSEIMPSCYFMLGTGNETDGIKAPLHNSAFDIDERALPVGSAILAKSVLKILNLAAPLP